LYLRKVLQLGSKPVKIKKYKKIHFAEKYLFLLFLKIGLFAPALVIEIVHRQFFHARRPRGAHPHTTTHNHHPCPTTQHNQHSIDRSCNLTATSPFHPPPRTPPGGGFGYYHYYEVGGATTGSGVGRGGGGGNLTTSDKEELAAHHLFAREGHHGRSWEADEGDLVTDHGRKEEGGWSRDSLNDTQIDDDERVRRYGILLTPGDAAQEDRWRIAADGYHRLMMVVVGCRTMTAWNTTTTPRGGWRAIGHRRLTTRTAERERRWGTTAKVLCRGAPPLPPPNPPHPWHDDRGCCIKKCCSIHCK
jgi:hypothetical protein